MSNDIRQQVPFLNVDVRPMKPCQIIQWLDERVGVRTVVLGHNLHSVYLYNTVPEFRAAYDRADLRLVDGFPILLGVNLLRVRNRRWPLGGQFRTGSCDWIPELHHSASIRRIAVIGASAESNGRAVDKLAELNPSFIVRGWDGFDELELLRADGLSALQSFMPDLVLVGLGMPLQERFIYDEFSNLPETVIAAVGGALDQLSGTQAAAPRVFGGIGLEWLYRLASDPKRLAYRYLVEPWMLARTLVNNSWSREKT